MKDSQKRVILYIATIAYIGMTIISITSISYIYKSVSLSLKFLRYVCYLVFGLSFLSNLKKITKIEVILLIISLLIMIIAKNKSIFILVVFLISIKELDKKIILEKLLYTYTITFLFIIICSLLKIFPDWIYYRQETIRHSLGFIYPTDCYSIFLIISLLLLYNKREKISIIDIIIVFIVNNILMYLTDGRMSYILINLTLFISIIFKTNIIYYLKKSNIERITNIIAYSLPILMFITTNLLVILYIKNLPIATQVNHILSDRVNLTAQAYKNYDITPFGQKIEWYGNGGKGYIKQDKNFHYNYVDNSYARMLLDYGVIFTLTVLYSYIYLLQKLRMRKDYIGFSVICIVLIWAFIEPCLVNIGRNVFMLLLLDNEGKNRIEVSNEKNSKKKLHI